VRRDDPLSQLTGPQILDRSFRRAAGPALAIAVAAGVVVGAAGPASAITAFRVASAVPLGGTADSVVLADVDADGDLDQLVGFRSSAA